MKPNFITALKAELIKKKHTGLFVLSALIPLVIPLINVIANLIYDDTIINNNAGNAYESYLSEDKFTFFLILFLPIVIIIAISRVTQMDHRNNGWRLMESLPLQKWQIYFSKFTVVCLSITIATFAFVASCCLVVFVISLQISDLNLYDFKFPLGDLVLRVIRIILSSLFATSFLYAIAVRLKGFIWPIALGMILTLTSLLSEMPPLTQLRSFFNPFFVLMQSRFVSQVGNTLLFSDWLSLIGAILFSFLGYMWYAQKSFYHAFIGNKFRLALSIIITGFCCWAYISISSPKIFYPKQETILAGKIKNGDDIHSITLKDGLYDSIKTIPVEKGMFHVRLDTNLALSSYRITDNKYFNIDFFLSRGDSIYLDIALSELKMLNHTNILGTRLAENRKVSNNTLTIDSELSFRLQNNNFLHDLNWYIEKLEDSWDDYLSKQSKWVSNDNYTVKPDFKHRQDKIASIMIINTWDEIVRKRAKLFPDQETPEPGFIREMKSKLTLFDSSLVTDGTYRWYQTTQLIKNDSSEDTNSNKTLRALMRQDLDDPIVQKVLFHNLKSSLFEAYTTAERDSLMQQFIPLLRKDYYKESINQYYADLMKVRRGTEAPAIELENPDGEPVDLKDFRGKYLAIDVWATWCGPCKAQSPYFEKLSKKMENDSITFLGISVDQNKTSWILSDNINSKFVTQLRAKDQQSFSGTYMISGIPTFMLIDPEGKIVNINMPYPDTDNFETMIRKEMGLDDPG